MDTEKEFRRKVLEIHFEISKGNSINPVDRSAAAKKLGQEDYNNDRLLGAIQYLGEKGYLKPFSNMSECITSKGIDEVENNFPNFNSRSLNSETNSSSLLISHSNVHFGVGDNIKDESTHGSDSNSLKIFWIPLLVAVLAIVIGFIITEGKIPQIFATPDNASLQRFDNVSTSTTNLALILQKDNSFATSLEKQDFLKSYTGTTTYATGSFRDISKLDQGYLVVMLVSNNLVSCLFGWDNENKLKSLTSGDSIKFSGTFTGAGLGFTVVDGVNPWFIKDCRLEN